MALLKTEITELRESIMNLRMTTQDAPANLPNMSYAAAAAGSDIDATTGKATLIPTDV